MAATAKRTDPDLWEKVKAEVTRGDKGGDPGEWSARKAQMAVQQYKKAGGGYEGGKTKDNHLSQWTREEWNTKSGEESGKTGERYLPKKAREKLSDEEYARTTAKKRRDTEAGKQFSAQPKDVAAKAATARDGKGKSETAPKKAKPARSPAKSGATKVAGKSPARERAAKKAGQGTVRKTEARPAPAESPAKKKPPSARSGAASSKDHGR